MFCSGLFIGDFAPVSGKVGDPVVTNAEARRDCGDDPYSSHEINDFVDNKRCECLCCNGSTNYNECEDFDAIGKSCKTYNERYRAHCVKPNC